eukprot:4836674-Prymnesium_polylepis.1
MESGDALLWGGVGCGVWSGIGRSAAPCPGCGVSRLWCCGSRPTRFGRRARTRDEGPHPKARGDAACGTGLRSNAVRAHDALSPRSTCRLSVKPAVVTGRHGHPRKMES